MIRKQFKSIVGAQIFSAVAVTICNRWNAYQ